MTGIIREFTTNGYARSMSFETKDMFSNNNNKLSHLDTYSVRLL